MDKNTGISEPTVVIPWWLVINPSEVSDNGQLPDND